MKSILTALFTLQFLLFVNPFITAQDADEAMKEVFGEEIEVPAEYRFTKRVTMKLQTEGSEEDLKALSYIMRYQEDNSCVAMTPVELEGVSIANLGTTVVDFNLMQMITFIESEDSKMATVYSIQEDEITRGKALAQESPEFKPTDNVKEILGYTCKEFKLTSTVLKGSVWLAEDIDINLTKSFMALGLQFELGDQGPEEEPRGFIMEFETTNKETKAVTTMQVIDVDFEEEYTLATEGFIFTTMPMVEKELQQGPDQNFK